MKWQTKKVEKMNNNSEGAYKSVINWFPGHMKVAMDQISERLKTVDLVIEIGDARAPISSLNPYLKNVLGNKKKVLVFSKIDCADKYKQEAIKKYYKDEYLMVFFADLLNQKDGKIIRSAIENIKIRQNARYEKFNVKSLPTRALVVGIPNVGKSTFINLLAQNRKAKVGNMPGFTKAQQLIKVSNNLELCDTPGILPPNYEDKKIAMRLAWLGTIKQDILSLEDLTNTLWDYLVDHYFDYLKNRYQIENKMSSDDFFYYLANFRHYLLRDEKLDIDRARKTFLKEFQDGVLGGVLVDELEGI